jgi:hypothetical protein
MGEWMYKFMVLTLALVGVSGQLHALTTLSLVPIGYEAGRAPEPVWTMWRREIVRVLRTTYNCGHRTGG